MNGIQTIVFDLGEVLIAGLFGIEVPLAIPITSAATWKNFSSPYFYASRLFFHMEANLSPGGS